MLMMVLLLVVVVVMMMIVMRLPIVMLPMDLDGDKWRRSCFFAAEEDLVRL
jgi:hypothetical protein